MNTAKSRYIVKSSNYSELRRDRDEAELEFNIKVSVHVPFDPYVVRCDLRRVTLSRDRNSLELQTVDRDAEIVLNKTNGVYYLKSKYFVRVIKSKQEIAVDCKSRLVAFREFQFFFVDKKQAAGFFEKLYAVCEMPACFLQFSYSSTVFAEIESGKSEWRELGLCRVVIVKDLFEKELKCEIYRLLVLRECLSVQADFSLKMNMRLKPELNRCTITADDVAVRLTFFTGTAQEFFKKLDEAHEHFFKQQLKSKETLLKSRIAFRNQALALKKKQSESTSVNLEKHFFDRFPCKLYKLNENIPSIDYQFMKEENLKFIESEDNGITLANQNNVTVLNVQADDFIEIIDRYVLLKTYKIEFYNVKQTIKFRTILDAYGKLMDIYAPERKIAHSICMVSELKTGVNWDFSFIGLVALVETEDHSYVLIVKNLNEGTQVARVSIQNLTRFTFDKSEQNELNNVIKAVWSNDDAEEYKFKFEFMINEGALFFNAYSKLTVNQNELTNSRVYQSTNCNVYKLIQEKDSSKIQLILVIEKHFVEIINQEEEFYLKVEKKIFNKINSNTDVVFMSGKTVFWKQYRFAFRYSLNTLRFYKELVKQVGRESQPSNYTDIFSVVCKIKTPVGAELTSDNFMKAQIASFGNDKLLLVENYENVNFEVYIRDKSVEFQLELKENCISVVVKGELAFQMFFIEDEVEPFFKTLMECKNSRKSPVFSAICDY